jgi:FkbM family methyltransferase
VGDIQFVMLRPDRCEVAKELYWGGGRRPKREDDFAVELFATIAKRSDFVLDVGAYTGLFTLVSSLVNERAHVHAFEFVPDVYRALFDNCVRNDILDRVTLHHVGMGEAGRVVTVPARSPGSALPSFYSSRLFFAQGTRIRFVSLDALPERPIPGASVLMKVDVEGTENDIFRNGQRFLADFHPDILCEVLVGVGNGMELGELLKPHGYNFYLVRDGVLEGRSRLEPDGTYRDWFLTTRNEFELSSVGLQTSAIPVGMA